MIPITDIRIRIGHDTRVIAYVDIVLDACLKLNGLKVIERAGGSWMLVMASQKSTSREFHDIYHPVNKRFRQHLETSIFEKVVAHINKPKDSPNAPEADHSNVPAP